MIIFVQILFLCIVTSSSWLALNAVSPNQLGKLTKEQLLELDREVSDFYVESYDKLDLSENSTSFEAQLYKSIRALRHTTVINHFDFVYTSNETKWRSMGARVNANRCKRQLRVLVELSRALDEENSRISRVPVASNKKKTVPLSVIDFFDSSGKPGSGALNGDHVWLGSYSSCERAQISERVLLKWLLAEKRRNVKLDIDREEFASANKENADIRGRYCVAHLRAKSWPKWDLYFEDRLTLRRGVCFPASCHSTLIDQDEEIRQLADQLARFGLMLPYENGDRFETRSIYCLPDEDSPFRQFDLGAKLFFAFLAFWLLLTIWANVKFHRRTQAMKKLRETVDIKMIINERLCDGHGERPEEAAQFCTRETSQLDERTAKQEVKSMTIEYLEANLSSASGGDTAGVNSAQSSAQNTPLPSDLEDAGDSEPHKLIEPFRGKRKKRSRRKNLNFNYESGSSGQREKILNINGESMISRDWNFDFVRDFSIETNLSWLLEPRSKVIHINNNQAQQHQQFLIQRNSNGQLEQQQQQLHVVRRTSSSNEALIKDLHAEQAHENKSKVSIISDATGKTDKGVGVSGANGKRVNVDILDGLKVIATVWIILGHTLMFFFVFVSDLRFGAERMLDLTMIVTINTLQVVGLFYVTTGCLLTYLSFSKAKRKQLLNPLFWLLVLIGRYVRLMPAYVLVFWFARHVAPNMGSGRDWLEYRTDVEHPRGYCGQQSWWTTLTMSAADIKIPMDCIPQAWYLSDDFRTLLVLPVYVFLLAKNALFGYSAIFTTIVYSTRRLVEILLAANIDYKIMLLWQPHVYALMLDRLHHVYTDFFIRLSTYLLGVVVGHLLYLYEVRFITSWPGWLKMRFALLTGACFFFGANLLASPWINQFLPKREELNSELVVWLIPIFKGAMELSIAITILLLVTGGGFSTIRSLLASRPMKILSNISYVVFLTHVEIMYKLPAMRFEGNYWHLFLYSTYSVAISHVVAFFVHLIYEVPINNLTRHALKRVAKFCN